MESEKLSVWKNLVKKLRALLRRNNQISDFLIFGSFVKGKFKPGDIDILMITEKRDWELQKKIEEQLPKEVHLENHSSSGIFYESLMVNLLAEGYSIKNQKFLKEMLGIKPLKLFIYNLKGFDRIKKVQFSTALTKTLKSLGGERIAAGAVLIQVAKASAFEDFLDAWGMKYKTKEYLVF